MDVTTVEDTPVTITVWLSTATEGATKGFTNGKRAVVTPVFMRHVEGNDVYRIEGVDDPGCAYMTGGHVVVLGRAGRNFGAGMCGGFAYVLDLDGTFQEQVNPERVDLEPLDDEDEERIQRLVRRHYEYTRSARADEVLRKWNAFAPKFVKVFPKDLKLALDARLQSGTGDG